MLSRPYWYDLRGSRGLLQGELLAQRLCVAECQGIGGLLLKNFVKLAEGFGIISRFDQCHGEVKSGFGQIRHDSHGFAKLPGRIGWLAILSQFQTI